MKKKGCLYWIIIGWWWEPLYFIFFSWWQKGSFLNEFFKLLLGIALILCLGTLSFGIAILALIGIFAIIEIYLKEADKGSNYKNTCADL